MEIPKIDLSEYDYNLPSGRIARYPAKERDQSSLLIFKGNSMSHTVFRNIGSYLPEGALLVFNNTRVIRARLMFRKDSGARIEILCLEPLSPVDYEMSFSSTDPVEWKCIIGNLKKWKSGTITTAFKMHGMPFTLSASRISPEGEAWRIRFEWNSPGTSFAEIVESAGALPLPPYLEREAEADDLRRYQTVYSRIRGSVAAPTAGLHFTDDLIGRLAESGTTTTEVTLHVGAGTFKPVKSADITDHEMHIEHFFVTRETIELLIKFNGRIIPVGTTSVRTLESLYWIGIKLQSEPGPSTGVISVGQWEPYSKVPGLSAIGSLERILDFMNDKNLNVLQASTGIIIVPGYRFRLTGGMVTNFHQPMSTLLLLVSAFTGEKWKDIYDYALKNDFRFLSYGDCSLLLK